MSILTRDSVRQALKSGITASQIIGYDPLTVAVDIALLSRNHADVPRFICVY